MHACFVSPSDTAQQKLREGGERERETVTIMQVDRLTEHTMGDREQDGCVTVTIQENRQVFLRNKSSTLQNLSRPDTTLPNKALITKSGKGAV